VDGGGGESPEPANPKGARAPAGADLALSGDNANVRLAELFEDFFVERKPLKGSRHTEAAYRSDLVVISAELAAAAGTEPGQLRLGQVTAKSLRRAFAHYSDNHSAASIARAWASWNQFFGFLVADETVVGNPMAAVAKPKVPARAPKALRGEGTPERLLDAVAAGERRARYPWPERDLAFVATAMLTGLRLSELLGLDLGSVDGREGERRLKVTGKGSKVRFVPIERPLEAVIDHYMSSRAAHCSGEKLTPSSPLFVDRHGERLRRGGAQYLVRQCYHWAGVGASVPQGALVHALRHTMATRLAEDGASASEIQHILGHASLSTSQVYIDATANEQRAAVRANRTYRALGRIAKDM
jgi:integrase/recombinase XerD